MVTKSPPPPPSLPACLQVADDPNGSGLSFVSCTMRPTFLSGSPPAPSSDPSYIVPNGQTQLPCNSPAR